MRTGLPKTYSVQLSAREREQRESLVRSRTLPHALVRRAKMNLG